MQEGDWRTLYDGPVAAGRLRELKPHAGCHGRGCDKIAMREDGDSEWHIIRGKPYCGDCSAKRRGGKKSVPEREAWLHENEVAKELVARGLDQAAAGQFSESPPDLDRPIRRPRSDDAPTGDRGRRPQRKGAQGD